jgi:predicted PilT family ATPase
VKPLTKQELKTIAKFVISEDSQGYLIGKHGIFTKQLEDIGIYMHCGKEQSNRALRGKEAVCSLEGTLKDIEDATEKIVKRLAAYYEASKKDYQTVPLALLIPYNLVTKIIGASGSMIKQLVDKTGANIRVGCSKDDPQTDEVVVTIDGTID